LSGGSRARLAVARHRDGRELRIRRDMRLLAKLDDHVVEDIGLHRCVVEYRMRHG
jgi:uncharacterized protein YjiS (DUF1127 family)